MNKNESFSASAEIGNLIAGASPTVKYTDRDVETAYRIYTGEELREMREIGLLGDDFELFYVMRKFCEDYDIGGRTDGYFVINLFKNARKFSAAEFNSNPYIAAVKVPDERSGNITLTTSSYDRGEIFVYDMPDMDGELIVPKLGFFDAPVKFPAIYEGIMPWMSVCPSEINSMKASVAAAHGRVLVLGLGLGYYPFMISEKDDVESVTVVELKRDVTELFDRYIRPRFPHSEKLKVVECDAYAYLRTVREGEYDYCFADIWQSVPDGADAYQKILPHARRLPGTEFGYWIEDQIKAYLDDGTI